MSDVLLTYGWVRSSYSALRNLSRHGISVTTSDTSSIGMCQFSNLSSGFSKYSSHYNDENKFISDILKICLEQDIKLIFPSHNETEIIARHRDKFKSNLVALIPDEKYCRIFNNKSDAYDLVMKLGIPVADRFHYNNPSTISEKLRDLGQKKTVIKLLTGNSGKGVFYGNSADQTQLIVENLINNFELDESRFPQVEEYVEGEGYGCSVLYWHGKYITHFTHKRLRDKVITGGTSTFREASVHKGIEAATKTIFDSIGWNGLAMCEFKVCPKTGKFWFIEVNPRMWGSISLAIESGIEFPYLAWLCANNGPEAAIKYHKSSKIIYDWRARWLLGDIFLILKNLIKLNFKTVYIIIFKERANSIDDFFWDDLLVFPGEVLAYLKRTISKKSTNPSEKGMLR
jgi:predicted ATP-grasp superfamily ATP-dependent carboligase